MCLQSDRRAIARRLRNECKAKEDKLPNDRKAITKQFKSVRRKSEVILMQGESDCITTAKQWQSVHKATTRRFQCESKAIVKRIQSTFRAEVEQSQSNYFASTLLLLSLLRSILHSTPSCS
jgi:hypothetical protein